MPTCCKESLDLPYVYSGASDAVTTHAFCGFGRCPPPNPNSERATALLGQETGQALPPLDGAEFGRALVVGDDVPLTL